MAKAKAKCKCKYCGAEFIREKTCRNRSEAESWESWAVDKLRECPKCYGERMRKEEAEKKRQKSRLQFRYQLAYIRLRFF